ncbi:MAG TPA: EAL domain-containing protein [Rhodocyclaceae bacterium]|nr:EAL domain-containing protein [Rhodocyclaceae bacterium]
METSNGNGRAHILIAEDSPTQAAQLAHLLEQHDFMVSVVANGREALAFLESSMPTLVISDILMPELDGYGLCKAIKSDEKLKHIPVMLVTTLGDSLDVIKGLECGADNFVRKPYDEKYLLSRIHYLLMNLELRKSQRMQMGVEINLGERKYFVTAERQQILDLLISTYEQAVSINDELKAREKDLAHSNQVLKGLYLIAEGLNRAGSEQQAADLALDRAMELPGIQAGWISLWDPASGFRLGAARNLPPALEAPGAMEGDCFCRRGLVSGELDHVTNILECERLAKATGDTQGLRYHASVPLWLGDRTLGVMNLVGPEKGLFTEDELKVLYSVGNQVAVALDRARLHEHLEHLVAERTAKLAAEIEQRKRIEKEQARLVAIIEATPDLVATANLDGVPLYCNRAGLDMLGYSGLRDLSGLHLGATHPEWSRQLLLETAIPHAIEHGSWAGETALLRPEGGERPVSQVILAHGGEDGSVEYLSTIIRDVTVQKENEKRIMRLNRLYAVLSGINTAIVRTRDRQKLFEEACRIAVEHGQLRMAWIGLLDAEGIIVTPVARAGIEEGYLDNICLTAIQDAPDGCQMVARALQEKVAVLCNDIATEPQMARWREEALRRGYRSVAVFPLLVGDKVVGLLLLYASEANFFDKEETGLLTELAGDISFALDHIEKEQRLNYLAYYDVLTGLPNRALLYDRLEQGTRAARRNEWLLAVLFVDLDNFKVVNDTLGHSLGDALLAEVSRRLAACLRDTDTVGRLGGDEFGIILPEIGSSEDAAMVARKVIESCAKPHLIEGHELFVSASVGITLFPDDAVDSEALIRNADTAMYRAKDLGRNTYQFYTAEMNRNTQDKLRLEADLRHALAKGEFLLHYQPKVSCVTGQVKGFEALLRWQHPVRGLVSPEAFVPALEESGLIVPVGEWVLHAACAQVKRWQEAGLGTPSVAVNISGRQIHVGDLCETVRAALASSGLDPAHLELELTESQLMKDAEGIIGLLRRLKTMGVQISVDDFGTGYSSLAYLKRFPIDSLKVDRAFVRDIIADPNDVSITRAIITLAHSLKLKVVAEGVETEGQLGLLIANHCDEIQGYYFSRPLPAEEATALLAAGRSLDSKMLAGLTRRRTLLLVDDEENILSALKRVLRRDGYDILTGLGAEQGLELLASHPVDVIVSDQRMPGMSGVEFLRRVKTLHPETVRLVLSGYTDLQAVTDAINEGAIYKFLTKPWDDGILRANIEEAFRNKEMADENRRLHSEVAQANSQMAVVNEQLQKLLASKDMQVMRDEASLDIAQEVLQQLPWPIIGIDDERTIALANAAAAALCGDAAPLLGRAIDVSLPAELLAALGSVAAEAAIAIDGIRYHLRCSSMGTHSRSRGTLLVLLPLEAAP